MSKFTYDSHLSSRKYNSQSSSLLVEKITRDRVFNSLYYNQYCFNLDEVTLLDITTKKLNSIGGFYPKGNPFPFLCLVVALIQLLPDQDIIEFYIKQDRFKYLKALGLLYFRIVYKDRQKLVEWSRLPDYRKLRFFNGTDFEIIHMDELIDRLINDEFFIGLKLTYMEKS